MAVRLIDQAIGIATVPARTLIEYEVEDKLTKEPIMKIGASQKILEVSLDDFRRIGNLKRIDTGYAGAYHPKSGRIFLVKERWCYSNLIHETLHSRSAFSKDDVLKDNLKFIFEGLTEFLVGLVLKKKIPRCYEQWKVVNSCFLSSYSELVKPWYYISKNTDFEPIISLYFKVTEKYPLKKLGKTLQKSIGGEFENVFSDECIQKRAVFDKFKDALGEVYGKNFAEFQRSVLEEISLDHM
ncbi:MAG: hypothetical protein ABSC91_11115 [Candidatus Bathyarchaeia archaeon]